MKKTSWISIVAATSLSIVTGCGSSSTGGNTSSSEGSSSSGSGSTSGISTGVCGGTGIASNTYEPLPTKTACESPTATEAYTGTTGFYGSIALASCGGMVGFAYVLGQGNIVFQALDNVGNAIGDLIDVGGGSNSIPPRVSIATNRQSFMVCWSDWNTPLMSVCAAVDPNTNTVVKGDAVPGSGVRVTWGAGGYVAVYIDPDTNMAKAQRVGDDGKFVGDVIDLGITAKDRVDIAAQGSTYAFTTTGVFANLDGMTLLPTDAPNTTGIDVPAFVASTSNATALAFNSGIPRQSVIAAGTTTLSPVVDLTAQTTAQTTRPGITESGDSFAAVWFQNGLRYRAFDEKGALFGANETTLITDTGTMSNAAIAATDGGFVVATTALQAMKVTRVECP